MRRSKQQSEESKASSPSIKVFRFYQISAALLFSAVVSMVFLAGRGYILDNAEEMNISDITIQAPFASEIRSLMKPLRYSGIPALLDPGVRLVIRLNEGAWILKNMRELDLSGEVQLKDSAYGLCSELAIHVYQETRHLFEAERFRVSFHEVMHSKFFPIPHSSHYVLSIVDTAVSPVRVYVLDPSFRRYGERSRFRDYLFLGEYSPPEFTRELSSDLRFQLTGSIPLQIKKGYIISLAVGPRGTVLNRENYTLLLSARNRREYGAQPLLMLSKKEGRQEASWDQKMVRRLFTEKEFDRLRTQLIRLFQSAEVLGEKRWTAQELSPWQKDPGLHAIAQDEWK